MGLLYDVTIPEDFTQERADAMHTEAVNAFSVKMQEYGSTEEAVVSGDITWDLIHWYDLQTAIKEAGFTLPDLIEGLYVRDREDGTVSIHYEKKKEPPRDKVH